jgi:hypothetical protein
VNQQEHNELRLQQYNEKTEQLKREVQANPDDYMARARLTQHMHDTRLWPTLKRVAGTDDEHPF